MAISILVVRLEMHAISLRLSSSILVLGDNLYRVKTRFPWINSYLSW